MIFVSANDAFFDMCTANSCYPPSRLLQIWKQQKIFLEDMSVITQRPGKSGDGEDSLVTPKSFNSSPINTATKIPFANSNSSPIIPKNYKPLKTGSSSSTSVRKQSQPISDNSDKMKELTDWGFDIAQKIVDYLFSPSGKGFFLLFFLILSIINQINF